jgi:hypothetical protein
LVPISPIIVFGTSPVDDVDSLKDVTTIAAINSKDQNDSLVPYANSIDGIKIQYPSDWTLVERGDNSYHMLDVVVEFLQPNQNNYYNPNVSASHNSIRLSIEDYSTFEDAEGAISVGDTRDVKEDQLQNIGNHRIGSIGISCPGFDIKSYNRNATLSGNPAYQISFDYSYLDNNKKATEIWTVKGDKVYIIDYVANEQVYDITLPVVQRMIEAFEITI